MPTITTDDGTTPARRDSPYSGLPNKLARAANHIDYGYRDTSPTPSGGSISAETSTTGIPR